MNMKYDLARSIDSRLLREHAQTLWLPSLLTVVVVYALIWGTTGLVARLGGWSWPVGLLIIAAIQNHFSILMHEAAHRLLLPSLAWNDRLGHALFAAPIFMHLNDYRFIHLKHHRYSGDPEHDPEVLFYQGFQIGYGVKSERLRVNLLNDLTGRNTLRSLRFLSSYLGAKVKSGELRPTNRTDLAWALCGWLVLLFPAFLMGFGLTLLVLWLTAFLTVSPLLIRWHGVGEHTGENASVEQEKTLTHEFPFLVNFFLYPLRSGYHLEHHLFPQIPWYQMGKLRRQLLMIPHYREEAAKLTVDGFWWGRRTVRELVLGR